MAKKESDVKYLATVTFDCNDADYVYGCKVISKKDRDMLKANPNRKVSFGSCDFGGGAESTISDCISIKKITEEEFLILKKLGLDDFGEGSGIEYILEDIEAGGDDEDDDEDDDW